MHLDKWLGASATYQKSVTRFLLQSTMVSTDLACVGAAQAPGETQAFLCKQSWILILHAPVLAQEAILGLLPNPSQTEMPKKID